MSLGLLLLLFSATLLRTLCWFPGKSKPPLPPGPKGLPLIGNLVDMPAEYEWKTFSQWGRRYGGICSIKLLGQVIVIVNTPQIFEEMDKLGNVFSSRPRLEMGGELCHYARSLVMIPYGSRWRSYRKLFAQWIGSPMANKRFAPIEEMETYKFLRRVLANPENLSANIRMTSGSIILKTTYGIEAQEEQDPYVKLIEQANVNFALCCQPGQWLVDAVPRLMKLCPEQLLPNGGFKASARAFACMFDQMVDAPFAFVQNQMAAGVAPWSFVSASLERELNDDEVFDVKHAAASMYGGGADTTASSEYAFFLAMTLYPDVQRTAQMEIDEVIGSDRLVALSDRPNLPYVNAVVTEILRWNSVAPTGVPHVATEDAIVGPYLVPKNAVVITNLWQILHDEETYPDPFTFDPSRHLSRPGKPAQRDPRFACFGWGRRICPGMHVADATVFLMIANALAVFKTTQVVEDGVEVTFPHENTTGVIRFESTSWLDNCLSKHSHPEPFKCAIRARSQKAASLITDVCEA